MKRKLIASALTAMLALGAGLATQAQTYSNAVMGLNPAGYWPLNETTQPPAPFAQTIVARNIGSLGAAGNGFYGAWYQPTTVSVTNINGANTNVYTTNSWYLTNSILQTPGVTQDGDVAMNCQYAPGQYVILPRNTNGAPNTALTLAPPFSIEVWVQPGTVGGILGTILTEGENPVNIGGPNTNNPFYGGPATGWAGVVLGQYANFFFFNTYMTNAVNNKNNELDSPKIIVPGNWYQVVATFDGATEQMYVNGALTGTVSHSQNAAGLTYVPDTTSPLMIGSGSDVPAAYGNSYNGPIDEVAIYNQVLPQQSILNHYESAYGTNTTYGANYTNAVLADSPFIYFRMDDPTVATNGGYPVATFPVATNYGALGVSANGAYQPGTSPGAAGPPFAGFGAQSKAAAINGWLGAVDVGLGGKLPAALNPTGTAPFSIVSWFQGNPADVPSRYQEMVGHGNASYRLALGNTAGGEPRFDLGASPDVGFLNPADLASNGWAVNDGNWHMIAGVDDGTNANLYVDGVLARSSNIVSGIDVVGSAYDLLLGGDPQFTFAGTSGANPIRNFDGQIAQVAFWTNALTAAQIQALLNAAAVPPLFHSQPVAAATANQGSDVTLTANATGSSLGFQWYLNGAPAPGQTNSTLNLSPAYFTNSGSYFLVASNAYGSATSSVSQLTIYGAPIIASQTPTNIEVFTGSTPTLSVATAGIPGAYQWSSNGVAIPNATNAAYTISPVSAAETNLAYSVTVSNSLGTNAASPISITVVAKPSAPYPIAVLNDHPTAYWRLNESGGTTAYDYVGGYNGTYTNVSLGQTGYSAQTDPLETSPFFGDGFTANSLVENIPTNLTFAVPNGGNGEFSVEAWINEYFLVAGDQGPIIAYGYGSGGEQFCLDTGAASSGLRFYVHNDTGVTGLASSAVAPTIVANWIHVVGVCDQAHSNVLLYVDGTLSGKATLPADTGILAAAVPMSIGARESANNNPVNYDLQYEGLIDDVAVYNYALSSSQVQAHYFAAGIAPTITSFGPSYVLTNAGASVTFTGAATGSPTLSYFWYGPNNNLIGTGDVLTVTNLAFAQEGQYTLTVSNLYGTATTNASLSVVLGAPELVQDLQPTNQTIVLYSGLSSASYTFGVSGSTPLYYQYYLNGQAITNATNAAYDFTAVEGTNNYYVTASNSYGSIASSTATIIGLAPPSINPTNFAHKQQITFPGYTRGEGLPYFPALVRIGPGLAGFDYSQLALTNGGDLSFADSSGTAALPYEVNQWNTNGTSTVWVEVPLLSSNSSVWMYWGNASATNSLPGSNIWLNANYQIVYHLEQTNFPYLDSTGQYPATNGVAPLQTNGIIGMGGDFDNAPYITPGPLELGTNFTLSSWVNYNPTVSQLSVIWGNGPGGYGTSEILLYVNLYNTSDKEFVVETGNGSGGGAQVGTPAGSVTFGVWHLLTATVDAVNGLVRLYIDGIDQTPSNPRLTSFQTTNYLTLGSVYPGPNLFMDGALDEARLRNGLSDSNWVWATYATVANPEFAGYSSSAWPELSIDKSGTAFLISWPSSGAASFTVQTASSLNPPATWTTVTNSPTVTNGENQILVQPGAQDGFYRLKSQ